LATPPISDDEVIVEYLRDLAFHFGPILQVDRNGVFRIPTLLTGHLLLDLENMLLFLTGLLLLSSDQRNAGGNQQHRE
jgi:hypothetical protein